MIRRDTFVGCAAALGMDENGIGCILSTSRDNKPDAVTGITAVILELCCVTVKCYRVMRVQRQ
jgi:hypothetical protein